ESLAPAKDEGNSSHSTRASNDDTDKASGNHGIGDQVSAKAHEIQDARASGDSKRIRTALSTFVHTLVPANDEGNSGHSSPASDDDRDNTVEGKGMGDRGSAKANENKDERATEGSQGIGRELRAFVSTLTRANQSGKSGL